MNQEFSQRLQKIEAVLHKYLPSQSNEEWKSLSFGNIDSCVNNQHLANLIQPCHSLLELGGKRWRPLLLVLCAEYAANEKKSSSEEIKSAVEKAYALTPLVEFSHTASLIHDDIEDCADTRRGKPAAHIAYGLDVALNAASWLYFEAVTCISNAVEESEKSFFYELFLSELRRLHLGMAMDILWHRNPMLIPSVDEYTAMVRNKTGTLSRLAVKVGLISGGASLEEAEKAGEFAEDLGRGFQIIDDVINLTLGNPGKKRGDDIVEGKKSLPVLIFLEKNPDQLKNLARLFEQARKEGIDSPAVEEAIELLTKSGAVDQALEIGQEIISRRSQELSTFYQSSSDMSSPAKLILDLFESLKNKAK